MEVASFSMFRVAPEDHSPSLQPFHCPYLKKKMLSQTKMYTSKISSYWLPQCIKML